MGVTKASTGSSEEKLGGLCCITVVQHLKDHVSLLTVL